MVLVDLSAAFALLLASPMAPEPDSTPDPWYGVEVRADDESTGQQLSRLLADHLDGDVELVDVTEVLDDDGATVTRTLELVLVNESDEAIIRAELADDDSIVYVEALRRPRHELERRYLHTDRLRNSMNGKAVTELHLVRDETETLTRVEISFDTGDRVTIDMTEFTGEV